MSPPTRSVVPHTDALETPDVTVVRDFSVEVVDGPDRDKKATAHGGALVVGTHETAGLCVEDGAVSRFHCELTVTEDGLRLRDLGSRNGTTVGAMRVHDVVVPHGTVFSFGRNKARVDLQPSATALVLSGEDRFGLLVGKSARMRAAFSLLGRAAQSGVTVLLTGETGTGKEAAAQSLHAASSRASKPFVVVDCSSVPAALFEAELFGHEKGAFTGAHAAREGAFEAADGGTLFIDEIGELSLDLQPKLLRVLERREIKRVGSQRTSPVDVRVVAATHRDLRAEVNAKRFRADLYYRLAVVEITLPSLRERPEDIPLLVSSLGEGIGERLGLATEPLRSPAFLAELSGHAWPGNVRELRNFLERSLALGDEAPPRAADPAEPAAVDVSLSLREGRERAVARFERAYLAAILEAHGGNVTEAARAGQVDRVHFYRLLWRHGLRRR